MEDKMSCSRVRRRKRGKGFTLIEIMVVISIISILLLMLLPNFVRAKARTRLSACESNLRNFATALELYARDNNNAFPTQFTALSPSYLKAIPRCPSCVDNVNYINGYTSAALPDRYTMTCSGSNHIDCDIPVNRPMYTLDGSLSER